MTVGVSASSFLAGCGIGRLEKDISADRPNIIFILTDDQRADTLGCMGNSLIQTPNIDRLAADGVLFENASITSAICTPSRISYFLGQYERRHGVNFNSGTAVAEEAWQKSYPALLKKAGYYTGYVGKNHSPIGNDGYSSGVMEKSFDYWYASHGHIGFYPKKQCQNQTDIFDNAKADTQIEIIDEGVMNFLETNEEFASGAKKFLEERPVDKPFCLSICFNLPHDFGASRMAQLEGDPEIYKSLYRDQKDDISLGDLYLAKSNIKTPKLPPEVLPTEYRQHGYDYVDKPKTMLERKIRTFQAVTGIDRHVGNVRRKLEELGLSKNTIIIYSSDHGIMQGEFGLGGKALNYERCLHVPMIAYDPRVNVSSKKKRRKELVQSIDIAPTLLGIAGISAPDSMQGASMLPLLQGKDVRWREHAFAENLWATRFGNPRIESVRSQRWKYIRYFENDQSIYNRNVSHWTEEYMVTNPQAALYKQWLNASVSGEKPVYEELYDLHNDPDEIVNLSDDPKHAKMLNKMRKVCQSQVAMARGSQTPPLTVELSKERLEYYQKHLRQD
ncbi:MAG: sulfatase-like hydrolase/transferase [Planctomycetes bacterium]|nr:sulfatase-like hydrolase/transferase [Planctomycetota bacterium]